MAQAKSSPRHSGFGGHSVVVVLVEVLVVVEVVVGSSVVVVSVPQGDWTISQVSAPGVSPGSAQGQSGSQGSAILFHVGDMPPVDRNRQ
jgi:hypothetical protein